MIPQMTAVADLTCSEPETLREMGVDVCKSFVIQHHVSCTKPQCLKYITKALLTRCRVRQTAWNWPAPPTLTAYALRPKWGEGGRRRLG